MPPVVLNLLIINGLIFMAVRMLPAAQEIWPQLALFYPSSPFFRIWQPLTYMFVQVDTTHLLFNMFMLWMFGRTVEHDLGSRRFLTYYLLCGVGAAAIHLGVMWLEMNAYAAAGNFAGAMNLMRTPTIGASGAIFGLLVAFGMMHANSMVMMIIPPIPMKAKYFVIVVAVIELFLGVSGRGGNVAHFAHLGGALWGFLILFYWKRRGRIHY